MTLVESLVPELKVAEVLGEFGIVTHQQHLARAEAAQRRCRGL